MNNNNTENSLRELSVMSSRHSAFYSPLLLTVDSNFMPDSSVNASYSVAENNQNVLELVSSGEIDIAQASVAANWRNSGVSNIVHFAEINKMDGFFLLRRENIKEKKFEWKDLMNSEVVVDHSNQPLTMFNYACYKKSIDLKKIKYLDLGSPEEMIQKFKNGEGEYIHLQGPQPQQLSYDGFGEIVASVGKAIGPVAFSSLCCKKDLLETKEFGTFINVFKTAKMFAQTEDPEKIAELELEYFPEYEIESLVSTISTYQKLNCWNSGINIPEEHYDQSMEIFKHFGLTGVFPYTENVYSLKKN